MRAFLLLLFATSVFSYTLFTDLWEEVADPKCINNKYKRVSLRILQAPGILDPHFTKSISNIKKANLLNNLTVDAYAVPSIKINATKQLDIIKGGIKGLKIGCLWLQVKDPAAWNKNRTANQAFVKSFVEGFAKLGTKVGIQTNEQNWVRIMGRECVTFSKYLLWEIRPDGRPDVGRFRPFGGWTTPSAKQYKSGLEFCGNSVNLDSAFV